jgi:1-acyl-sn-glycerol-3-phosphate acyltransferase
VSLSQRLARLVLACFGWKVIAGPPVPAKGVLLGYPHTSNWDLAVTLLGLMALGITPRWVGKDTMFKGGLGTVLHRLGGIPVNRNERTGFVDRMAREIARQPAFLLAIAPEGTRSATGG